MVKAIAEKFVGELGVPPEELAGVALDEWRDPFLERRLADRLEEEMLGKEP